MAVYYFDFSCYFLFFAKLHISHLFWWQGGKSRIIGPCQLSRRCLDYWRFQLTHTYFYVFVYPFKISETSLTYSESSVCNKPLAVVKSFAISCIFLFFFQQRLYFIQYHTIHHTSALIHPPSYQYPKTENVSPDIPLLLVWGRCLSLGNPLIQFARQELKQLAEVFVSIVVVVTIVTAGFIKPFKQLNVVRFFQYSVVPFHKFLVQITVVQKIVF